MSVHLTENLWILESVRLVKMDGGSITVLDEMVGLRFVSVVRDGFLSTTVQPSRAFHLRLRDDLHQAIGPDHRLRKEEPLEVRLQKNQNHRSKAGQCKRKTWHKQSAKAGMREDLIIRQGMLTLEEQCKSSGRRLSGRDAKKAARDSPIHLDFPGVPESG